MLKRHVGRFVDVSTPSKSFQKIKGQVDSLTCHYFQSYLFRSYSLVSRNLLLAFEKKRDQSICQRKRGPSWERERERADGINISQKEKTRSAGQHPSISSCRNSLSHTHTGRNWIDLFSSFQPNGIINYTTSHFLWSRLPWSSRTRNWSTPLGNDSTSGESPPATYLV